MTWAIIKCPKCGRITFYPYCAHKRLDCTNKQCANKIWIVDETMISIKFGTDFQRIANTAYIFINCFNSYAYLAAKVYSEDGRNYMTIPISERNVSPVLTRNDTIKSIPAEAKHITAWDGQIITSGCYPVSPEMETEIKKNMYIGKKKEVAGGVNS